MQKKFENDRNRSIAQARALLRRDPLILDTETTGLDDEAEICEIAIVRHTGEVALDARVRPVGLISQEASAVHGIRDEDVADAPGLGEALSRDVLEWLLNSALTTYNMDFDLRLLHQSAAAVGHYDILNAAMEMSARSHANCLMRMYARYHGGRASRSRGYKWQSLEDAARQMGFHWEGASHSALGDARMALKALEGMAASEYV